MIESGLSVCVCVGANVAEGEAEHIIQIVLTVSGGIEDEVKGKKVSNILLEIQFYLIARV